MYRSSLIIIGIYNLVYYSILIDRCVLYNIILVLRIDELNYDFVSNILQKYTFALEFYIFFQFKTIWFNLDIVYYLRKIKTHI